MVNIARLCFGLNMLTTLPLEAFVCREVMLTYFYPDEPFDMKRHLLFSTGLVLAAMVLSLVTCDLGAVFELVGATSAVAMAYILPPMCYIKLTTRSWRTYMAYAVVGFGSIVMVISVVQAVQKIVSSMFIPLPRCPFRFPRLPIFALGILYMSCHLRMRSRNAKARTYTTSGRGLTPRDQIRTGRRNVYKKRAEGRRIDTDPCRDKKHVRLYYRALVPKESPARVGGQARCILASLCKSRAAAWAKDKKIRVFTHMGSHKDMGRSLAWK
ncbi:hypothetical protein AUP68_16521 [Ilyonectria robusta]